MKSRILYACLFSLGIGLHITCLAAPSGIYQRDTSEGAIELSNLMTEEEGQQVLAPSSAEAAVPIPIQSAVRPLRPASSSARGSGIAQDEVMSEGDPSAAEASVSEADGGGGTTSTTTNATVAAESNVDPSSAPPPRQAQYRDLMLSQAAKATQDTQSGDAKGPPANPAASRRYLMVNKADYMNGN